MILAWLIVSVVIGLIVGGLTGYGILGLIAGGWFFFAGLPKMLHESIILGHVDRITRNADRNADRITGAIEGKSPFAGKSYDIKSFEYYANQLQINNYKSGDSKYRDCEHCPGKKLLPDCDSIYKRPKKGKSKGF